MPNAQQYAGSRSQVDRNRSQSIWSDCKFDEIMQGNVSGVAYFEDFVSGGLLGTVTTEAALTGLPLSGAADTSGTHTYDNAKNGGGGLVLTHATSGKFVGVRSAQTPFQISSLLGKLWFEINLKISSVTASDIAFFAGLISSTAMSATIPLVNTTGAFTTTANAVGFHKPLANTTTFNTSYVSTAGGVTIANTGVGALAASTYVKLGMKFDPRTGKLSYYINGVKQANTTTIPNATATGFPATSALGWGVQMTLGASSSLTTTIDWVRIAQLI